MPLIANYSLKGALLPTLGNNALNHRVFSKHTYTKTRITFVKAAKNIMA